MVCFFFLSVLSFYSDCWQKDQTLPDAMLLFTSPSFLSSLASSPWYTREDRCQIDQCLLRVLPLLLPPTVISSDLCQED